MYKCTNELLLFINNLIALAQLSPDIKSLKSIGETELQRTTVCGKMVL